MARYRKRTAYAPGQLERRLQYVRWTRLKRQFRLWTAQILMLHDASTMLRPVHHSGPPTKAYAILFMHPTLAGMAELADAADSKSADPCGHGGSTPPPGTSLNLRIGVFHCAQKCAHSVPKFPSPARNSEPFSLPLTRFSEQMTHKQTTAQHLDIRRERPCSDVGQNSGVHNEQRSRARVDSRCEERSRAFVTSGQLSFADF